MAKPLLSPVNVDALTEELYGLSDSALLLEANAVAADFTTWLGSKFDLTPEQTTYIGTYSEKVKKFYGYLFAAAFLTRSPVVFAAAPDNPVPRRIKETRANLFGEVKYNDNDQDLDGALNLTIEFALL